MYKIIMTNSSTERETFIVQNITLGWHSVSDIGLLFAPTEVKDLTWEDENVIRRSRNLKDSIRNGILRKLSPEEYEKTMEMQYQKETSQVQQATLCLMSLLMKLQVDFLMKEEKF